MRYLLLLFLCGCATAPKPVVAPEPPNKNRDAYVDRLEHEASEGAAAIIVAKKNVEGKGKPLLDLTETRLTGIKKPTAEQVDKFSKTITSSKALETEQTKAKQVDAETTKMAKIIADKDRENEDLRNSISAMKKEEAWKKVQDTFLLMALAFGFAGAGFMVANTFIGKGLRAGVIMFLLSGVCAATPFVLRDVVEALWFRWALGISVGIGIAYGLYAGLHTHREVKCRLLSPKGRRA
jgi:cytosine/uracil/thiamine/allantoin permease